MMKSLRNKGVAVILMVALMWSVVVPMVSAEEQTKVINYISLGDSLAAGVTSDGELGDGYSDMVSAALNEKHLLGSFTKEFAYPGLTSQQVLETLDNSNLQEKLKSADVVTISSGANDFLNNVTMTENGPQFDMKKLIEIMYGVQTNLGQTIEAIHTINPTIDVYVMGYYFPYPHLLEKDKEPFIKLSKGLNQVLASAAAESGATYVSVFNEFGTDAKDLLPNPQNVHPNKEGYTKMTEAFLAAWEKNQHENPPVYTDLPKDHWAFKEIMYLSELGMLKGKWEGEFQPSAGMTRAEAAMALVRLSSEGDIDLTDPGYSDVPKDHPAYPAIATLKSKGVFAEAPKFNPNQIITRAELSKVLVRGLEIPHNTSVVVPFPDVPSNHWGAEYIHTLSSYGIVKGYNDGEFKPRMTITRAEFSVMAYRLLQMN
ncbi:S-layer homology domain-containing protein [Rossellomorea aquimaris]|uniref:S-layer homology domain-containing protein n=1 Tax=Rossellomorea aquimaris TaxID=189382 RepID=UPI001CFEFBA0|nr:S-layer homology domain-containing protein [Rossellomorea aquimaris]